MYDNSIRSNSNLLEKLCNQLIRIFAPFEGNFKFACDVTKWEYDIWEYTTIRRNNLYQNKSKINNTQSRSTIEANRGESRCQESKFHLEIFRKVIRKGREGGRGVQRAYFHVGA